MVGHFAGLPSCAYANLLRRILLYYKRVLERLPRLWKSRWVLREGGGETGKGAERNAKPNPPPPLTFSSFEIRSKT